MRIFRIITRPADRYRRAKVTYGIGPSWYLVREAARAKFGVLLIDVLPEEGSATLPEASVSVRVDPAD